MRNEVLGCNLDGLLQKPLGEKFNSVCRRVAAEGIVLLKNENKVLPLKKGSKVSVFGKIQDNYIRSGTGSGGLVNVEYTVGIAQGLENAGIIINKALADIYAQWEKTNPFDTGTGWASEPWSQTEMALDAKTVENAAKVSDAAIVIIGRTAGEDKDNSNVEGSFLLTATEEDMLLKVRKYFDKVIVLLNVGNIIDMKWINKYAPDAVMYVWQGGQEGGNAVADIIVGNQTPSGRLSDSIAYDIEDYPSTENFNGADKNIYSEDIYVGYRYFNTFAKQKLLYPFGFGLSYTSFDYSDFDLKKNGRDITVGLRVRNTGGFKGQEVVQIYCSTPQGMLGKPERVLAAYKKTELLMPNEEERLEICFSLDSVASFDDSGVTEFKSCFVLEHGEYKIFVSSDSLNDKHSFSFELEKDIAVQRCNRAVSPRETFERIKPLCENGVYTVTKEKIPAYAEDINKRIAESLPVEIPCTGDKGIKLINVKNGENSMEDFVAQFSDEDLACIAIGEGMNSPKVTGGTGCAFGGVTESLLELGIPVACGTDGPSGIRMDTGAKATLMPNGTLLACTWNDELIEELYTYEGIEMCAYNIDVLLGPGINIHRNPLNGRNFEYFSEDPLLTGKMAAAICRGIDRSGASATIKHFCANNQEKNRHTVDSVVSERALREIYLKAFEIALKDGSCKAVMTSYNPVNGYWSSGNYDLNTTVLRNEWGYDGFVMSDWWAKTEKDFIVWGRTPDTPPRNFAPMVYAQNDIYMVNENASDFGFNTILNDLHLGKIKRSVLQRNAMNICRFLMNSNAFESFSDNMSVSDNIDSFNLTYKIFETVEPVSQNEYEFQCAGGGKYLLNAEIESSGSELSQNTVIFYINGEYSASFTVRGSSGENVSCTREICLPSGVCKLSVKYPESVIKIKKAAVYGATLSE